jgi:chitinase
MGRSILSAWAAARALLGALAAAGLLALAAAPVSAAPPPPGLAAQVKPSLPAHHYAPYIDTSSGQSVAQAATASGVRFFTLAFVISGSGCRATWNGSTSVTGGFYKADIGRLRAMGGDVVVSFGGAAGTELGLSCRSVASLQAQYQSVIDSYGLSAVDFDVEGSALGNRAANDRRNKAIAGLQAAARAHGKTLTISYTLPVDTTGLPADAVSLVRNAKANGVDVGLVNIMTMDYGGRHEMGQAAVAAATAEFKQLQAIFPGRTAAQLWAMQGNTPMIGVNDDGEVFTLKDAQTLTAFAQQKGITRLAMWSLGRDRACPGGPGGPAKDNCSGVVQQPWQFSKAFNQVTR